jgi:hypothetical protein
MAADLANRSPHAVLMDGSVRAVTDQITSRVWRAFDARVGAENMADSEF